MPEMDGFEATVAIRAREAATGVHTPIIAMTAHALKGDRDRCLAAGMDGYVSKPIKSRDLQAALEQLVPADGAAEAAPSAAPEPEPPQEVLDRAALMDYVGGDRGLLSKIVRRFLDNSPKWLAQVQEAVARGDGAALEFSAHTLKGVVGNFFAAPARAAAFHLESLGHAGRLDGAAAAYAELEKEVGRLREALAALEHEAQP